VSFTGGATGTISGSLSQGVYKAYCVNIETGALVWGPTSYTGVASFTNGSGAGQGPEFAHGYIWFYVGSNICKMDPATGTVTVVQAVAYPGQCKWIGDVLYHWDDTTKHLYKIKGILSGRRLSAVYTLLLNDD